MPEKTVKQWITIRGRHIPIFEGESKEDAINRLKEGAKKGKETTKMHAITNRANKKEALDKAAKKSHQKSQAFDSNPTERRKKAYEKAHEETQKAYKEYVDAKNGKVPAHFNFGESAIKGQKKVEKPSPMAQASKMTEGELQKYIKDNDLKSSYNTMMNKRPGGMDHGKQMKVMRDLVADDMAIKSAKGNKESAPAKPVEKAAKPAVTEESIQKELSRTATRLASKGYNTPESIEKHIRELSSIRKNDLAKKMGIGGRGEEKIKAMVAKIHEQQQGGKKQETAPAKRTVSDKVYEDTLTKTQAMGWGDPGDRSNVEIHNKDKSVETYYKDDMNKWSKKGSTDVYSDRDIADKVLASAYVWPHYTSNSFGTTKWADASKKAEKEKSWQDKDAETKAKQIANADKQKAAAQEAQKEPVYKNPVKAQEDMRERHEQRMIQEKEKAFANKNDSWEPKVGDRIGDVGYNQAENKLFNAPAGTVIEMNSRGGDYIGEYTKQEDGSWKGSQKYKSGYSTPPTVNTAKGFAMHVVGKDVKVMNVSEKKQEASTVEPSRLFGNALWNQSNRDMTKELKGLEEGTQVSFRTAAGRRTWTRYGTGFVDDSGKTYSNMAVAGLLIGAWKHGGSSTLGQFYKDNLKLFKRN